MIGFVIALKSKAKSKNWEKDSLLVSRTIRSILNQSDQGFKIYIAYSDLPGDPIQNDKVQWIQFPYPFAEMEDIEDREVFLTRYTLGSYLTGFFDQGKKSLYAASFARKEGCKYIMSVDYDDLISNRIAEFVNAADASSNYGWFMNKGYVYREGDRHLIKVPKGINNRCGSCNIIRTDYVPDPDFSKSTYQDFKFFPTHNFIPQWLWIDHKIVIEPLPFYGLIYLIHNTNFYNPSEKSKKNIFEKIVALALRGSWLSSSIKKEFGFYPLFA